MNRHTDNSPVPFAQRETGWTEAMLRLANRDPEAVNHAGLGGRNTFPKYNGSPFFSAATQIADAKLPVFPCIPYSKSPLSTHGFKDATTSGRRIARWADRWPDANLAIATGGAGVDVVDVDAHENGSGFSALERARRAGLIEGWALIVRTPSGGLHLYYPALPERPQRSWSAGEVHIDFRGTGGYILAPPSTVSQSDGASRPYEVIAVGRDPRPLDAVALKAFLRPTPTAAAGISFPAPGRHTPDDQRIAGWMARRPEGSRNSSLFWAACRYVDQGLPEHEAQRVLLDAALKAGLTQLEATATIGSAYRHTSPNSYTHERSWRMQW
ncbi:bifunctional DNA primase/polymerase [Arthrobacter russicus]|uniref:DNA primase/polymerase bifunctional N-terminal domain-containing protein n=1 Tax=Arthrobacter russicus TaxID=172040 RepID=A0ABU1JEU7_9MICC|nr:bifunctional DNA primase/polymerase [Arthrobacter russicus]MDR6270964.1 hypothetical protein [Arthrobacter russicus]